jgi:hypothetical protein
MANGGRKMKARFLYDVEDIESVVIISPTPKPEPKEQDKER